MVTGQGDPRYQSLSRRYCHKRSPPIGRSLVTIAPFTELAKDKTIIGGSCHKYHFCRDKSFVAINTCLWRHTRICLDKTRSFVCYFFPRQKYACRNEIMFVAAKYIFSRQKLCRGKHTFVATKDMFVQTHVCRVKTFVATKKDTCGSSHQ